MRTWWIEGGREDKVERGGGERKKRERAKRGSEEETWLKSSRFASASSRRSSAFHLFHFLSRHANGNIDTAGSKVGSKEDPEGARTGQANVA